MTSALAWQGLGNWTQENLILTRRNKQKKNEGILASIENDKSFWVAVRKMRRIPDLCTSASVD